MLSGDQHVRLKSGCMDVCNLAQTGADQSYLTLLGLMGASFAVTVLLIVRSGLRGKSIFSMLVILMLLATVIMPTRYLYAQDANICPPAAVINASGSSGQSSGSNDGARLVLNNDTHILQFPTFLNSSTFAYFSLLENDVAPDDDVINRSTIALDFASTESSNFGLFQHPDTPTGKDCYIASLSYGGFGVLRASLEYSCSYWDDDLGDYVQLIIPSDYQIPVISYTAMTQGGLLASGPALITVSAATNIETGVLANEDYVAFCNGDTEAIVNILDNDTTSGDALDPLTIDVDPSTSGVQQQIIYEDEFGSMSVSVDGSGAVRIVISEWGFRQFYNTVQSVGGVTSNITTVEMNPNACLEM